MTNRNGDTPEAEERAPTAAWRLTPDLDLEAELELRRWRLIGLQVRADEEGSS